MKTKNKPSKRHPEETVLVLNEQISGTFPHFDLFSSISTENFYVFDTQRKQICAIQAGNLLLCGLPVKEALVPGCDFYAKIIYPADFSLCATMYTSMLQYFEKNEGKRDEIDSFFCTFRLHQNHSDTTERRLSQMVYHRIKPVWESDELRYLVCSVGSTTCKDVGKLRMHSKNGLTYEEYNFTTKRWQPKTDVSLSKREKAILMLAEQGKSSTEIADELCKGINTIRNQTKHLFSKLNVHSMQEAIEFARNHRLLYISKE